MSARQNIPWAEVGYHMYMNQDRMMVLKDVCIALHHSCVVCLDYR